VKITATFPQGKCQPQSKRKNANIFAYMHCFVFK
jgi:hypothetical protein